MNIPAEKLTKIDEVTRQLQAGANMPAELLEIFSEEAEDHLRTIYDGLGRLQNECHDTKSLADVRRASHTLKGAAGAVGLQAATRLSHRMEDLLDGLAENKNPVSSPQLSLLLQTADQLQNLTSGEFDIAQVAQQIADLYQRYDEELGAQPNCSAVDSDDSLPCPSPLEDNKTKKVGPWSSGSDAATNSAGQPNASESHGDRSRPSTEYLRVPLPRLDELVNTLGEMVVNRSEFQQKLSDFESRIEDMQNAMERLRHVSHCVGVQSKTTHYAGENRPSSNDFSAATNFDDRDDFDQLEFERFGELHLLEQTLAETDKDAEIMSGEFQKIKSAFDSILRRQQQLNRDAQNSLMRIRMVPLVGIKSRLERTVRTVSNKLGRTVKFELVGDSIELDKTVLDAIIDPLQHLIRNALDHGIEDPKVRISAGKPETASLRVEAINEGTKILLRVIDDGAGINLDKVREKALQQGLITSDSKLSDKELRALIFRPGFSTASQLTDVSGRGVGMDVVGATISQLKGTIRVSSEVGSGTTFAIELPTTVGVSRAMMIETHGQKFAIPMQSIDKVTQLITGLVDDVAEEITVQVEGRRIRMIDLGVHLRLRDTFHREGIESMPMLVIRQGNEEVAVTVDSITGCQDIAVKPMCRHLKKVRGFNGATVDGHGVVIPVLDTAALIDSEMLSGMPSPSLCEFSSPVIRKNLAMVIDDSISVRRVTENILSYAGWDVVLAKDGVDALEKLAELDLPPDVFLCDMEMPRMDGLELIRQIREQDEFESTPIVMVTSRASEKHRHKAFAAGATEYVVKPFNDEQMLSLLLELVQESVETVSV